MTPLPATRRRGVRLARGGAAAGLVAAAAALAVVSSGLPARASTTAPALPLLPNPLPSLPTLPSPAPSPSLPALPSGSPSPGSTVCPTPALNPVSADPSSSGVQTAAAAGAPAPQGPQSGPAGTWVTVNGTNLEAPGCWTFVYLGSVQQALPAATAAGTVPPEPSATSITFAAGGTAAAPLSGPVSVVLSPGGPPTGGVAQPMPAPAPGVPAGVPAPSPAAGAVTSNANLTFVEPPSIPTLRALQGTEGAAIDLSGAGFQLGGLVSASPLPQLTYHQGADPATSAVCNQVATDAVSSDTSLRGYAATTFCSGAVVVDLVAPRDTDDPAAGVSQVSAVAGSMEILPAVLGITPQRAAPDQVVAVIGSGFGRGGGATATVGGVAAPVAAWHDRVVEVVVPQGAADGTVTLVRGEDGRGIAAGSFTLLAAAIGAGGIGGVGSVLGGPPGTRVLEQPLAAREPLPAEPVGATAPLAPLEPPQQPRQEPQLVLPLLGAIPLPGMLRSPLFGVVGLLLALGALTLVAWRRRTVPADAGVAVIIPVAERRSPFSGPVWQLIARVARRVAAEVWRQQSVRATWARLQPPLWKAISLAAATLMVNIYVIAAVSTLTALAVILGFGVSAPGPEGKLYLVAGVFVSLALTAIAFRYVYYYRCWAVSRQWFRKPEPVDVEGLRARELPYMKVQVTTKGGALPVVERSLDELRGILERQPWLQPLLSAEVITEVEEEARSLEERYAGSALAVTGITLPADYQTPKGTRLKARALHYMCELRRKGFNRKPGRTFVIHFDEETLVDEANLLVLVKYLSEDPRPVSQGPILYPLEWSKTPWICRALESTRPFGCSECARAMEHPPPPHLHGSNLVVDEQVETRLGWDFGTVDGQPYVAEDLLFGLRAYAALGEGAFGWHGATMLEQPPFSLYWAVQQRLRWVLGALQGLRAMTTDPEYADLPREQKRRLVLAISFRIATYALGFPVGFAGLYFVLHPAQVALQWRSALGLWHVLIIISGLSWFLSYQIGIARNLLYQKVGMRQRVLHAVVMVLLTPIAGFCETVGPFVAVIRWMFGLRRASWTPTPKLEQSRLLPGTPPA